MKRGTRKFSRELKTIAAMIDLFCRKNHGSPMRCTQCADLFAYVAARLERCPHGEDKPTCARCEIHCYSPEMRSRIARVMRYSGPRLGRKHPILLLLHLLRGVLIAGRAKATLNGRTAAAPVPCRPGSEKSGR